MKRMYWCIKNPNRDYLILSDCFVSWQNAIEHTSRKYGQSWQSLYKKGFRAIQVTIRQFDGEDQ